MGGTSTKEIKHKHSPDARICIIGAGPAGTSAAYYLMNKKGYTNVTVIEKKEKTGGKCWSYEEDGKYIEMGAVEVTADYKNVLRILEELNMNHDFVNMLDVRETTLDRTTGVIKPYEDYVRDQATNPGDVLKVLELDDLNVVSAAVGYLDHLHKYKDWIERPGCHGCPAELGVPFMTYLKQHNLAGIARLFVAPVTLFGYGDLSTICAGYAMKYMNQGNFITIMQRAAATVARATLNKIHVRWRPKKRLPARLPKGYQSFVTGMEAQLRTKGCTFLLNTVPTKIDRKDGTVKVTTQTAGEAATVEREFDYLIVAYPQRATTLGTIMNLTPAEKEVFGSVNVINYHTMAMRDAADPKRNAHEKKMPDACHCTIMDDDRQIPNLLDGKPTLVYAREDTPVSVVYALSDDEKWTQADFEREAVSLLIRRLGYKFEETMRCSCNWEYFPHFTSEQFVEKHNQLYGLQGQWNTFYTGGLCCFENVERCVEYSHFIVDKFF